MGGLRNLTVAAGTANCGGVALLVKEKDDGAFSAENAKVIGPNVISCKRVTARHKRWFSWDVTCHRRTRRG